MRHTVPRFASKLSDVSASTVRGDPEIAGIVLRYGAFYGPETRDSAVPHVVMLSSLGAELAEGTGPIKSLHYLENALRATGTKLIAIRACYFQENIASIVPAARQAGIFPNFLPSAETPIPMIATQDIGRLGATLLKSPHQGGETVDLIGPMYSARASSPRNSGRPSAPQLTTIAIGDTEMANAPRPLLIRWPASAILAATLVSGSANTMSTWAAARGGQNPPNPA